MSVEAAVYISQLDPTNPPGGGPISEGDNHLRLVKATLVTSFPNFGTTAMNASAVELNYVVGVTSLIQVQIDSKAPIASPVLTGIPKAPTAAAGTGTTQLATTEFVQAAIGGVNAQTALAVSVDTLAAVACTVGVHKVCTNAARVTATLPVAPASGQRARTTFTNALSSNLIDPGAENIFSLAGTKTVNAVRASIEWTFVNSTIGWVYS